MSFIPVTPGGTLVVGLAADTYHEAKKRLMHDAAHMPYPNWKAFKKRGYVIEEWSEIEAENPPIWCGHGMIAEYKP